MQDAGLADCRGKHLGILIVTFNALSTISSVLKRITPNVWANVEEVVVSDDASQDSTYELAMGLKLLRNVGKLHVLKHPKNLGYGGNQKAGYRYFIEKGFDVVVLLHGDGQYAPEILSHLYHPIVAGEAEAVFGSRMMPGYGGPLRGGMPLYKYAGNRILTVFENHALNLNLTEFHSGYRAYDLKALAKIDFSEMTGDFHFDTEIIIKLQHQGFRIKEVPIPTYYGTEICYVNGMKYAWNVARAIHRYRKTANTRRCYAEFKEYWAHYPIKESRHSSHDYLRRFAGSGNRILDLGCGEGVVAARLVEQGNSVTGVDAGKRPAHAEKLERYYQCDLAAGLEPIESELRERAFDEIVLMDVLEHLPDPARILRACRRLLAPHGRIMVSVPNVANITVRLLLLLGRFEYADRGILDRTHLRFYTRNTARKLLSESGYEIESEKMTVMPVELVLGLEPGSPLMRLINGCLALLTRMLPGLLGYQCVLVARPGRGEG